MYFKLQKTEKAQEAFERLLASKEQQYGPNSKELVGPMMQVQHMSSSGGDTKGSLEKSIKANKLIDHVVSELDNNLVMNSGSLELADKIKIEMEIKMFQKYKIDVLFTIHNLYKIEGNFSEALVYAKQHTAVNEQIYKKSHKCYAYALLLEAQCMSMLPNLDHTTTLATINEALQVQLRAGEGKIIDPFLGRIYEEKGHILKGMGGTQNLVKALQAFNSAQAIMVKSGDNTRIELSERMIQELSMNKEVIANLTSKFDTDFLTDVQKNEFEEGPFEDEAEAETDTQTTILIAAFGVIAIGALTYLKFRK